MSIPQPRLITQRTLILDVRKRWLKIHYDRTGNRWKTKEAEEVAIKLSSLNLETVEPDVIEEIVGPLIRVGCTACGSRVTKAVQIGHLPDYDSDTAHVCEMCAYEINEMFGP